jgi:hypothetical protein
MHGGTHPPLLFDTQCYYTPATPFLLVAHRQEFANLDATARKAVALAYGRGFLDQDRPDTST